MYVLGITGPIGSGKTTVMRLLAEFGAQTLAADAVCREIMQPGSVLLAELRREFGDGFFQPDGSLDRGALGQHVFSHPNALRRLNAKVHPKLKAVIGQRIQTARQSDTPPEVFVIEAAVMAEMAAVEALDGLLYVDAEETTRVDRLCQRDGLSRSDATSRIKAQEAVKGLAKKANWILDGAQPVTVLRESCRKIYEQIRRIRPSL